ncbi:hypothetical protein BGW38_005373, partial [Lunasporangiospora selenospora]
HSHPAYPPHDPAAAAASAASSAPAATSTTTVVGTVQAEQSPAAASSGSSTTKPKKTTTTSKAKKSTQGSTTDAKSASTPKAASTARTAPKTFRFEGSISSESFRTTKSFDLAGVNILNRKPLDTKTALDKLQRRRETHNRVERKRRDCINQLIDDLTQLLPTKHLEEVTSKCHRVNVLRGAVSHIKYLHESNEALQQSLRESQGEDTVAAVLASATSAANAAAAADFALVTSITNRGTVPKAKKASGKALAEQDMTMDVDDASVKDEEDDDDDDDDDDMTSDLDPTRSATSTSSPALSSKTSPTSTPRMSATPTRTRPMIPPPVIITDAPSPAPDASNPASGRTDPFSLDSHRRRSNSFASSISDMPSPRSSYPNSPLFPSSPISPISPLPHGEGLSPSLYRDSSNAQLSPFLGSSPSLSPSLPPISSLANLHLQSPSGHLAEPGHDKGHLGTAHASTTTAGAGTVTGSGTSRDPLPSPAGSFSGRHHRGGATLPPLMIPEPHNLHPSYHQSANSAASNTSGGNGRSGTNSNRNSLTLSPHSADHAQLSPHMLSPLQSRSPSMGPMSTTSPMGSPHPFWPPASLPPQAPGQPSQEGVFLESAAQFRPTSPQPGRSVSPSLSVQSSGTTTSQHTRHKSLQPEPIFIQEEPWNVQRKRSTSSNSGKASTAKERKKASTRAKEAAARNANKESNGASMTSVFSTSPNPKKRSPTISFQGGSGGGGGGDDTWKRPKSISMGEDRFEEESVSRRQQESGVTMVVNEAAKTTRAEARDIKSADEDAAQALTSLANISSS